MSGTLFFYLSKIIWILIRPETWFVFLFLFAALAIWRDRRRSALVWLGSGLTGLVLVGLLR